MKLKPFISPEKNVSEQIILSFSMNNAGALT
jgi:hypothetical protein